MGSQRVGHNWATSLSYLTFCWNDLCFLIINYVILLQFFFLCHLLLLTALSFEILSPLYPMISASPSPFFPIWSRFLFHHLPHSQSSVLNLKRHSSSLILFGILCGTLIVLSSNFMTPIYDFKFYDSNLCLQYPSLRPFPPAHIYISLCLLDIIN